MYGWPIATHQRFSDGTIGAEAHKILGKVAVGVVEIKIVWKGGQRSGSLLQENVSCKSTALKR